MTRELSPLEAWQVFSGPQPVAGGRIWRVDNRLVLERDGAFIPISPFRARQLGAVL